jgi:L-threonylcarbamoyladenylate synthase
MSVDDAIEKAVELLRQGEVVGLPTETVYGLAADATSPSAVARIFQVKGRPSDHPLIVHLGATSWLENYAEEVPPTAELLAKRFWPGPLTLILRRGAAVSLSATGGLETVGLRVPDHPVALEVLRRLGKPLAAPSANRFGAVSPTTRAHVMSDLGAEIPLVLEGGECRVGVESTIVDLTGETPRLLRPGGITQADLEAVLGCPVPFETPGDVRAPGTLESHYAPRARIVLAPERELFEVALRHLAEGKIGILCGRSPTLTPELYSENIIFYELGATFEDAAHALYTGLRALDESGCDIIVSYLPPPLGLGLAISDRLARAAAPR